LHAAVAKKYAMDTTVPGDKIKRTKSNMMMIYCNAGWNWFCNGNFQLFKGLNISFIHSISFRSYGSSQFIVVFPHLAEVYGIAGQSSARSASSQSIAPY
jgi:hypothetical protein